jgi:subtilisin family serine protease
MITYNIIYDKTIEVNLLISELTDMGATSISHLESLNVLVASFNQETNLSAVSGISLIEIDANVSIEPSAEFWHKLRVVSESLPMRETYTPKNKGLGTTVYLVDSGVDTAHEELTGASIHNLYSYDNTFTDTLGHGTQLATLIVGSTLGVTTQSTLKVVKIPFLAEISVSTLLTAFNAILADHLQTPTIVKVVNCSWIISKNQLLDQKISELQENNLVVVAAAGNNASAADNYSPVGLNTVIGVAASDAYDRVINWGENLGSNWGPDVDITAPGIDINLSNNTTGSGTSIAAAIVSGIVCQFINNSPDSTAQQIQTSVLNFSTNDVLFRNESIYGTTPNRLLRTLMASSLFGNTPQSVDIQIGTTQQLTFDINVDYITTVEIGNTVLQNGTTLTPPTWVSLSGNVMTITPPQEIDANKFIVRVRGVNNTGNTVSMFLLKINAFTTTPDENDMKKEVYPAQDTTGMVIVYPAFCYEGLCGAEGQDITCSGQNTKEYTCGCSASFCFEQ